MSSIGAVVKALRQGRGMSQVEVAAATGTSQTYLSDVEGGKVRLPSVEHRRRLADVLGTSNVELLVAAEEVNGEELAAWARQAGFVPPEPEDAADPRLGLSAELAAEDLASPRVRLALLIPSMTRREAAFLRDTFKLLPTEAHAKRHTLTGDAYRRWRDHRDREEMAEEVREVL